MKLTELNDDQLITVYRKARDRRDDAKAAFAESQKALLELLGNLELEAKRRMDERGATSFKSEHGTCFVQTETSVSVKDKSAFFDWLETTGKWELADIRAAKKELQNFAEATGGDLPPGVNMTQRKVAHFRAPRNK